MSVRLRISVFLCRQDSATGRFYEPLDLPDERMPTQPAAGVLELPARPGKLTALSAVAGGGQMMQATSLVVEEPLERRRRCRELLPLEMPLRPPDRPLAASL